ncbi:hypothetical protein CMUST_10785 [Corynebacterium mustelae]|uniref:Uncharacterized protein n=1 Tax=Corynebacterium mustelae TaxID=571915 RepID=A0A0G3H3R4_9CORY|nr:hypothetical protein CMUST_10785 [Corynebacterium mustelae]
MDSIFLVPTTGGGGSVGWATWGGEKTKNPKNYKNFLDYLKHLFTAVIAGICAGASWAFGVQIDNWT